MFSQLFSCLSDISRMRYLTANDQSFRRYAIDRCLSMLIDKVELPQFNRKRQLCMQNGELLTYRLNKGDMQSIREVYLDQTYQLPTEGQRKTLVDLGGNIGLSTMWLTKKYRCESVVCVEPSQENLAVLKINLEDNRLPARVIEAAVGAEDGEAYFETDKSSNLGHLGESGIKVRLISMATVIREVGLNHKIDLMKIDIEGAEELLLTKGDRSWLQAVNEIVIEMHPPIVDRPRLIEALKQAGFIYFPPGVDEVNSMDYFKRQYKVI